MHENSAMSSRNVELTQTALIKIAVDGINFVGSLQNTRSLNCLLDFLSAAVIIGV